MRQIYESAEKIYVWLGMSQCEASQLRLAVAKMKDLDGIYAAALAAYGDDIHAALASFREDDPVLCPLPGYACHQAWAGIGEICRHDWWHRA